MFTMNVDQFMEDAVARRRSAEAARKARIFNTRLRVIGIDTDALNQQAQEKRHRQNMEMQRDKAFDKQRNCHDDMLLQRDVDVKEKRAARQRELTQYWATCQRAKDSLDADLKCGLKGAFRITIPENELGPASMQIFQGEGLDEEQNRREQMKKTEKDLQAQKEDNERRRMRDKHREMIMSKEQVLQDLRGVQLHALEEESKKAARIALNNYNQALATEHAERLKEQHRREESENLAEILHTLTSDMMTEHPEAAKREVSGRRPPWVQVDKWKGMSPEQLNTIHRQRDAQRLARQRQRDAEKAQDLAWDLHQLKISRELEEEDKRAAELRRRKRIDLANNYMQQAKEHRAHQQYLNKELYTNNKPTKDFFNQFNTSSR